LIINNLTASTMLANPQHGDWQLFPVA